MLRRSGRGEKAERRAGLRAFARVAVASCGIIQAAEPVAGANPEAMMRVVEGIITGMGFIGGDAILRMKELVKGTATAASFWGTGATGTAVGLGSCDNAISVFTTATHWTLSPLRHELDEQREAKEGKDEN